MLQASGVEEVRQLYSKAEQLLIWVTTNFKLLICEILNSFGLNPFIPCQLPREQKNKTKKTFCDPGDRGEREPGRVGCSQHSGGGSCLSGEKVWPTILVKERERKRKIGGSSRVKRRGDSKRYEQL